MQSTITPSPRACGSLAWQLRTSNDTHADVMTAYYAGWFLDAATAGPRSIRAGIKEQQFPCNVESDALGWFHGEGSADLHYKELGWGMDPYTHTAPEVVFAFEHFSRFETANRVWPPLVPATWRCCGENASAVCAAGRRLGAPALTYRRDWSASSYPRSRYRPVCCHAGKDCPAGVFEPHNHYQAV